MEVRKEGDLWERQSCIWFFGVDGEMIRGNPQWNKIDVRLNSGHWSWEEISCERIEECHQHKEWGWLKRGGTVQ